MNHRDLRPYRPNSLAAWFLFLTMAAVLAAIVARVVQATPLSAVAGFVVAGAIALSVPFGVVGIFFRPRLRNAVLGFASGSVMGGILGMLIATPTQQLTPALIAVATGSVMIVLVGLVGRSAR